MIENLVFDVGRVLIEYDTALYARLSGVGEADLEIFRNAVFRSPAWLAMEGCFLSRDQAVREMCSELPERLHPCVMEAVDNWWKKGIIPMTGMEDIVRSLHNRGYALYILSNAPQCIHSFFPSLPVADCFAGAVFSCDVGMLKPQKDIFRFLFEKYSLSAEECFFIDDMTANIEAGRETGMQGCVFRGAEALKRTLSDRRIL